MQAYSQDDVRDAPPGHFPLVDTDLEVSMNKQGDDVIVRINKAGVQILRVNLEQAARDLDGSALIAFSTFAPDFVFKIGDTADGMRRLARSVGAD